MAEIDESKLRVPGELDLIDWEMPHFAGNWRAHEWQDPESDRIAAIREEFALQDVVADAENELDELLALKRWVRSQWDHGWSHSYETVNDALDILREARRGEQFCCGHYSTVFVACAAAIGIPARTVSLSVADCSFPRGHDVGNVGHCVAEAWWNDIGGWVLVDCDLNLHYERDGVPLRALDVHDAWLAGEQGQVRAIYEEPEFVVPGGATVEICGEVFEEFRDFDEEAVRLKFERFGRNDVMDYYARVRINGMEWLDRRCAPTFVRHFKPGGARGYTDYEPDLYPTLNCVRVGAEGRWDERGASLTIRLEHCMPWFERYEARIDGGAWRVREETFEWPMHEGANCLDVRAVNVRGRPGPLSIMEVLYAAPVS